MVGHQAVAEYLDTALLLQLAEAGEVVLVIAPLGENELAVMTSLNDVVRITRHDESPCPWHDRLLSFKAGSLAFDSERGRELAQALGAGYIGIYLLAGPTPQLGGRAAGKRGQIYFPLRSNEP